MSHGRGQPSEPIADSLGSGILIGAYNLDIYGETSRSRKVSPLTDLS